MKGINTNNGKRTYLKHARHEASVSEACPSRRKRVRSMPVTTQTCPKHARRVASVSEACTSRTIDMYTSLLLFMIHRHAAIVRSSVSQTSLHLHSTAYPLHPPQYESASRKYCTTEGPQDLHEPSVSASCPSRIKCVRSVPVTKQACPKRASHEAGVSEACPSRSKRVRGMRLSRSKCVRSTPVTKCLSRIKRSRSLSVMEQACHKHPRHAASVSEACPSQQACSKRVFLVQAFAQNGHQIYIVFWTC